MACIAAEVRKHKRMMEVDDETIRQYMTWGEFNKKPTEHNALWRNWCRLVRQEAHKRGLKVP